MKRLTEQTEINFSCLSAYRSEEGGVRYGECTADHHCEDCVVYRTFYEKADEYQREGNPWGKAVALAKRYFNIPTVPEYDVEAYSIDGTCQAPCTPEYLGRNTAIGCRNGECKCGNIVRSYQKYCDECGAKLNWEGVGQ